MKVLILSPYFPPFNSSGALRTGKYAKYLVAHGHDVRVIAARNQPFAKSLPLEIPADRVLYAASLDINGLPKAVARARRRVLRRNSGAAHFVSGAGQQSPGNAPDRRTNGIPARLGSLYINLLNWPDAWIGWLPFALSAARKILKSWTPDMVYASSPPATSLALGHLLARRYGVPWVAEFRDRWADDPYYPPPEWRQKLEHRLERRMVASAAALVTVSEPWAAMYREKYGKPTEVVYNGFDPEDFEEDCENGPAPTPDDPPALRIVYTGGIYPGRRDPTPLFRALQRLGPEGEAIRVEFFGPATDLVVPLARLCGVAHLVATQPPVSHADAVAAQQGADVLLLLQWDDPKEQGNIPAKLFEYLAARRPILSLGLADGVPAAIIGERGAGLASNDAAEIAGRLEAWLAEKKSAGRLAPLPEAVRAGFSRDEQFGRLQAFLERVLASAQSPDASI